MTKVTKEELKKIAAISSVEVTEQELEALQGHVQAILTYAERVKEVGSDTKDLHKQRVNVLRNDEVIRTDSQPLLSIAPDQEENYFVVPKIIETN